MWLHNLRWIIYTNVKDKARILLEDNVKEDFYDFDAGIDSLNVIQKALMTQEKFKTLRNIKISNLCQFEKKTVLKKKKATQRGIDICNKCN